jgi:hypothetical protein
MRGKIVAFKAESMLFHGEAMNQGGEMAFERFWD